LSPVSGRPRIIVTVLPPRFPFSRDMRTVPSLGNPGGGALDGDAFLPAGDGFRLPMIRASVL